MTRQLLKTHWTVPRALLLLLILSAIIWSATRKSDPLLINDVSQLNPIRVAEVITPTSTEQIVDAVKTHSGPISVGGGRYSSGGQTATEGALQLDMRQFNRILDLSTQQKTITVQAGANWRQIQERIDKDNLSVKVMQSYANFTVGGSLSVNAHGRYVGRGPIVMSVRAIKIVLPDGKLIEASRTENRDIFFGAIGGYGGLGVITEATLDLTDNVRIKRQRTVIPVSDYKNYFLYKVKNSPDIVLHNADLYTDSYNQVESLSYVRTDDPVTIKDRVRRFDRSYTADRFVYWAMSEWPHGKIIRRKFLDPIVEKSGEVMWLNYEAGDDLGELEPSSRDKSTYLLQEYFVPVDQLDAFIPKMRSILQRAKPNVLNISIRHAEPDKETLLSWAPHEVFSLVLYFKQDVKPAELQREAAWTRELIEAALSLEGSYYLPYQLYATPDQFLRAYPSAPGFFALKKRIDPTNKFRNKLWDKYYSR